MGGSEDRRTTTSVDEEELRSAAQLRFLHSLALRLNALDDVGLIAEAITTELKTLIDYHACRIYLLQDDGETALVIVPDYQLSLAIGKEGQNARLAARLTGLRVDIKSESQMRSEKESTEPVAEGTETAAEAVDAEQPAEGAQA